MEIVCGLKIGPQYKLICLYLEQVIFIIIIIISCIVAN